MSSMESHSIQSWFIVEGDLSGQATSRSHHEHTQHPAHHTFSSFKDSTRARAQIQPLPPPLHSLSPQRRPVHVDIASIPTVDLLKKLAELLSRIATATDKPRLRHVPQPTPTSNSGIGITTQQPLKHHLAVFQLLSFYTCNVPTISIESYFMRILKYCPTINEVF
ncbi:hypothetical protein FRC02_004497 [Tulasnella sp. 418]|nr:hypothetical protein FRC02_004497 [Tulasnella sp. 418]